MRDLQELQATEGPFMDEITLPFRIVCTRRQDSLEDRKPGLEPSEARMISEEPFRRQLLEPR